MPKQDDKIESIFDPEKYVHCQECNIWYPKERQEEAKQLRAKMIEKNNHGAAMMISDCPLCAYSCRTNMRSLVTPEESAQHENLSGTRIRMLRPGKGEEPFIFLDKKE
jgi:ferredoxin